MKQTQALRIMALDLLMVMANASCTENGGRFSHQRAIFRGGQNDAWNEICSSHMCMAARGNLCVNNIPGNPFESRAGAISKPSSTIQTVEQYDVHADVGSQLQAVGWQFTELSSKLSQRVRGRFQPPHGERHALHPPREQNLHPHCFR